MNTTKDEIPEQFNRCGVGHNLCNCKTERECGYLNMSDDPEDSICENCGYDMDWEECWSCGGEGGTGGEELMCEDPLWYSEDDFMTCDICDGEGGFYVCRNNKCQEDKTKNSFTNE